MKINYLLKHSSAKFNFDNWLSENEPVISKVRLQKIKSIYQHYLELKDEFREFLNSTDSIFDEDGTLLSAIEIYNDIQIVI